MWQLPWFILISIKISETDVLSLYKDKQGPRLSSRTCEYIGLKGNRMVCSRSLGLLPRTGWELWKLQQVKINAGRQSNCKQKSRELKDETKIGRGYLGIFYWAKDHHEISRERKSGATGINEHSLKMPQKPKLVFPKGMCMWKTCKLKAEADHMHDGLHGFLPMLTFTLLSTMTVFENKVFINWYFCFEGSRQKHFDPSTAILTSDSILSEGWNKVQFPKP